MKRTVFVFLAGFCLTACAEQDSRPQYQPCPHPFDGGSCPDDCWPVVQRSTSYPDCDAAELLLGCASGPQELPEYTGPGNHGFSFGPLSRSNGLSYSINRDYYAWFDANESRFCSGTPNDCPDPDPDIVAACEEAAD